MSLPPISALIVLDALARTGSVRATATEVHLSQSAVSHKLKALETQLGFALTIAKGRGVALTGEARRYVAAIRPALALLHDAHDGLDQAKGRLEIAVTSGFAATWLAPRLSDFLNRYPEISFKMRSVAVGEEVPACDLGIVFTDTPPRGAKRLFDVTFFPVCSPDFLHKHGALTADAILPDMLLHLDTHADWAQWLEMAGQPQQVEDAGVVFSGLLAMYAAAEAGLGLCLGDAVTSEHALRSGRLLRPFEAEIPARAAYWITPAPGGFTAPAAAFADWLQDRFDRAPRSSFAADGK
ncbi:LysR family transcriptional regulator [Epibacterium ulvae]|uniref:LysR substrate-binding domain-containing protein n=1 Tax=Epibacterium ulvae TaxID=1156985 RepID=UPI001BFC8EF3|nr:LysR substrate-binding domain-containing protein [Epibacterium ulvae]MBT8154234.1 LysR family transcriptional regulator [Epibacterium ulvae]